MNAAEALPPGDAFPAPHKADCAKLRKNNGRFADLQASHPNRFADPSTHVDASIAGVKKTVRLRLLNDPAAVERFFGS
jgi:hypothetical protein